VPKVAVWSQDERHAPHARSRFSGPAGHRRQ